MSWNEGLVDLSLFAYSPTDDSHFNTNRPVQSHNVPTVSREFTDRPLDPVREFYAPRSAPLTRSPPPNPFKVSATKPLPRLPPRTLCGAVSIARECDSEPTCILTKMKRKRTGDSPNDSTLPQRRNVTAPPQLTLSVPQMPNHRRGASEMVWMAEEQMWLVLDEGQRDPYPTQNQYPTPPAYSPPTSYQRPANYARSDPGSSFVSQWATTPPNMTPPISPIQTQLRSLIETRDEERLSPLFQEAMNSVPMMDTLDPPPPPTYEGTVSRQQAPRSAPPSSALVQPSASSPKSPPITRKPLPLSAASSWVPTIRPPVPPIPKTANRRPPPPARAASTGSTVNYSLPSSTSALRHSNSGRSDKSAVSSLGRSKTEGSSRSSLRPATSSYHVLTPDFGDEEGPSSKSELRVGRSHHRSKTASSDGSSSNRAETGSTLEFLEQEMAGNSRSWHGFARKLSNRP